MPCRGPDYDYSSDLKKSLDDLTKMLCDTIGKLESRNITLSEVLSEETLTWWKNHKKQDEIRSLQEQEDKQKLRLQELGLLKALKEKYE